MVSMHPMLRDLSLVVTGGTVGTAAREALILGIPTVARLPLAILTANVMGAFALGLLLESLTLRGDDSGARRHVRLVFGTGVLGGFTTYSALSLDVATLHGLSGSAAVGVGLAYGLGSVVLGVASAWWGVAAARAWHRPQEKATP